MAAMWKVEYKTPDGNRDWLYLSAADARSMKRKDHRAAVVNCRRRAKQKLTARGVKATIVECRCVG